MFYIIIKKKEKGKVSLPHVFLLCIKESYQILQLNPSYMEGREPLLPFPTSAQAHLHSKGLGVPGGYADCLPAGVSPCVPTLSELLTQNSHFQRGKPDLARQEAASLTGPL